MKRITIALPNGKPLTAESTGKSCMVRLIPDGGLFLHENQLWEKLPDSNGNLSDFDDESEVQSHVLVEECKQIKE